MKKINSAVIGLGQIGYTYDSGNETTRTHVSQIIENKQFRLIAACDADYTKIKQLKTDGRVNIPTYSDFKSMLDSNKIELLVLAVQSAEQKKIIDYSLTKNIKNFIIEKPFLSNNDEIADAIDKVASVHGKIYVNYPRTWDNEFLSDFKNSLSEKIQHINAFISGNFKENACHLIDLIFQSLSNSGDHPKVCANHTFVKNASIKFKAPKQTFNMHLTHIESNIDLFEVQIFFPSHILFMEYGGAKIYRASIHKDKFYKNYNGMRCTELNFSFNHQKGLAALYSHTSENFGKSESWEEKLLSSFHIHDFFSVK